jgi:hypothetical protein
MNDSKSDRINMEAKANDSKVQKNQHTGKVLHKYALKIQDIAIPVQLKSTKQ